MELDQNALREKFRTYTVAEGTPNALKTIAMVGATPRNGKLQQYDSAYLEQGLNFMAVNGLPVAADFTVIPVNIDPEYGGVDMLHPDTDIKVDVLLTCFLPRADEIYKFAVATEPMMQNSTHLYSQIDDNSGLPWHKAALRSGAKAIVTMGGSREIDHTEFCSGGGEFVVLQQTPRAVSVLAHKDYLEGRDNNVPGLG